MCKRALDPTTTVLCLKLSPPGASNNLLLHGIDPCHSSLSNASPEEFPGVVGGIDFISILSKTIAFSSWSKPL